MGDLFTFKVRAFELMSIYVILFSTNTSGPLA